MPRTTFAALPLLAALALLSPGRAVAGPPEGASGRMVLDEVADGLRKYRREEDDAKRIAWLRRLAPTRDARVAAALEDCAAEGLTSDCWVAASELLRRYYPPRP
ncbi:MAG TPA: hypothetical protein VFW33_04845 [Gemmataceae bacterium]|nr:hypothetical protein [Gemmataceae bacterium]